MLSTGDHDLHPTEQDANSRAFTYFNNDDSKYKGWDFDYNPINGYKTGLPISDIQNQMALNKVKLSLSWYDYCLFGSVILPGLVNTFIQNSQQ